jgi:hypothetical protein
LSTRTGAVADGKVEIRDVFLDEFADTDDEHEDEEAEEREIRREEKRKVGASLDPPDGADDPVKGEE